MSALKLEDAKKHLNITGSAQDDELQTMIDAAETAIEHRVGPLTPRQVVTTLTPNGSQLVLPVTPVLSLTSVVPSVGTALDVTGLIVDEETGIVGYADYAGTLAANRYTVTYQAGRSPIPADLLEAVDELVRHLWRTQRGPTARPTANDQQQPGAGFLIPYAVAALIEPYAQIPVA